MEIISESDFLIHRYTSWFHPILRGQEPFIVTGPRFHDWVIPGSLHRHREYRFRSQLEFVLRSELDDVQRDLAIDTASEFLLRTGICEALWVVNVRGVVPPERRWLISCEAMAREIPRESPLSSWVIELLSGMTGPDHYRSKLAESRLILEPAEVPAEF